VFGFHTVLPLDARAPVQPPLAEQLVASGAFQLSRTLSPMNAFAAPEFSVSDWAATTRTVAWPFAVPAVALTVVTAAERARSRPVELTSTTAVSPLVQVTN
jgi:hypothetical protein